MNLTVVHVLERPPENWAGEASYVTGEVLSRHLPHGYQRWRFFICGLAGLMDAAQNAQLELGVPGERVHTRALQYGVGGCPCGTFR
jgi:NAD(P)H-flavin reductase